MRSRTFGNREAPVILLLPGACRRWKGSFGHVVAENVSGAGGTA